MSKRSRTILVVQVRIPVPAGKTQEQTLEWMKMILTGGWTPGLATMASPETQLKIVERNTTYL